MARKRKKRRKRRKLRALSLARLRAQCRRYWRKEKRDAMYRIALDYTRDHIGQHADMADGLAVMLLTWNQAAYRYGAPDPEKLEEFLREHEAAITVFRGRAIASFDRDRDGAAVEALFKALLAALYVKKTKRRSPVGVAKALHLLAPRFFPLWDVGIAQMTRVHWGNDSRRAAERYVAHMANTKRVIAELEEKYRSGSRGGLPRKDSLAAALKHANHRETGCKYDKSMLKYLDECYYAIVKLGPKKKTDKKKKGKKKGGKKTADKKRGRGKSR